MFADTYDTETPPPYGAQKILGSFLGGIINFLFGVEAPASELKSYAPAPEMQANDDPSIGRTKDEESENQFDCIMDWAGTGLALATNIPVIGNAIASGGQFAVGGVRAIGDTLAGEGANTIARHVAEDEAAATIDLIPFSGDVVAAGRVARLIQGTIIPGVAKLGMTMESKGTVDSAADSIIPSNTPVLQNTDVPDLKSGT